MTNSIVTCSMMTNTGREFIFSSDVQDGSFQEITDLITGSGLGSLQGQTIVKCMAHCENFVTEGGGIVIVDPQNTPISVIPVCQLEQNNPMWQDVSIGPINLNWAMKVYSSAALA
mgnify:CR=1 FL=1